MKRFPYSKFVRNIAARCLESSYDFRAHPFDCPSPPAAERAMTRLIGQLRRQGRGVPKGVEWSKLPLKYAEETEV